MYMLSIYKTTITGDASCILLTGIQMKNSPKHVLQRINQLIQDSQDFMRFVRQRSDRQDIEILGSICFTDCFSYFGLYLAVRSSNWQLRVSCLKLMAPMFAAYYHIIFAKSSTTQQ